MINKLEGFSYLALLFIAMPLKYLFSIAVATRIAGSIHGFLFVIFCVSLAYAMMKVPLKSKTAILFFLLSLVPFGSFYVEHLCKTHEVEAH